MQKKFLMVIRVDVNITGQLLIMYFAFVKYLRTNGNKMRMYISCVDLKKANYLYNLLINFGTA
jgi:hypothetical protein